MVSRSLIDNLGRWLIALFFLASAFGKMFAFQQAAAILAAIGFPGPQIVLVLILLIEIVGGTGLLLNVGTRHVSRLLVLFLIFATITIHGPLMSDPNTGPDQIVHIIKNIAIIGGLLRFVV
jgi:putative oxidoreductase